MNAFLTLTVRPTDDLLEFIRLLNKYIKAYIVVDDNTYIPEPQDEYFILQVPDEVCEIHHYTNINHVISKPITSWNKVIFFLNQILKEIKFCWIVEDDVFIPTLSSIIEMTKKYSKYDLVSVGNDSINNSQKWFHWKHEKNLKLFQRKYLHKSMLAAVGMSRKLLNKIEKFAQKHHTLAFLEIIFNTLAYEYKLKQINAPELSTIVWRKKWSIKDFESKLENWFHPIKEESDRENKNLREKQVLLRQLLFENFVFED
jgi:hypothetical protein